MHTFDAEQGKLFTRCVPIYFMLHVTISTEMDRAKTSLQVVRSAFSFL